MKTYKKLLVGLGALAVILPSVFMFMHTPTVQAASTVQSTNPQDMKSCIQNLTFVSIAEIDCTFTPVGANSATTVKFIDSNPSDGDGDCFSLCYRKMNYAQQADSSGNLFFANGIPSGGGSNISGSDTINPPGITVENSTDDIGGRLSPEKAGLRAKLKVNLEYSDTTTGQVAYPCRDFSNTKDCTRYNKDSLPDTDTDVPGATMVGPKTKGIANLLQFNSNGVASLDGVTDGDLANLAYTYDKSYTGGPLVFTQNLVNSPCSGEVLKVNDPSGTNALRVVLDGSNQDLSGDYPGLLAYLNSQGISGCGVDKGKTNFYGTTTGFNILGTFDPSTASGGGGTKDKTPPGGTDSNTSCESNQGSFNWLACPLLGIAQDSANFLLGEFQKLLSFNVDQDLGNSSSQANVKTTWSLVRNLATAFLVILMLIMVFSQAISAGPFDAYTVRKMLPRLIAMAIAIQLSWAIVAWIIGIFNDLGKGIADIMYYPFGGADKLDLQHLLNNAGISTGTASTISWVGIPLLLGVGLAALPATLLLLLGGVAALFTAYFTLIIRKIIIICLLIFAPIAMLAYVLPNTQKYWKLWYDNLIKILFMYPLIVIMIAAGKIFADIAGGQGGNNTGGALNFVLVMVAFFGPLFLLPKTYKWGGQAMSIASGAVGGISNRYLGRESGLGKGLQGFGERTQGQIAKGYDPNASKGSRFMRRLGSGHVLPTPRSRRLAIAAGDKWANERNEEAEALANRTQEKAMNGYDYWEMKDGKYVKYARYKNASGQYEDADGNIVDESKAAYADVNGNKVTSKRQAHATEVSKDEAHKRMTGVEAGKQALVDLSGLEGGVANERLAQAAQKRLIDTSSEIELQNSVIQGGPNAGKRVMETASSRKNVASSPPHYTTLSRGRFDFAPDVMDSAEADTGYKYATAKGAEKKALDVARLKEAIKRMTPDNMQNTHYGFYQDVAAQNDPEISGMLAAKIADFHARGGTIGSSAVGSLRGGRAQYVDQALKAAGATLDGLTT